MTVLVEKSVTTLEDGIEILLESAKTDYINRYGDDVNSDVAKSMIDRFNRIHKSRGMDSSYNHSNAKY